MRHSFEYTSGFAVRQSNWAVTGSQCLGREDMGQGNSALGILWGGLIAGTMDITAAVLTYKIRNNVPPIRILQSVASGLLGKDAFTGGAPTAALGLFLHFVIAFIWTT